MGEIFTRLTTENSEGKEEIIRVEIDDLHDFRRHPFHVREDEEMKKLTESIRECGILNPILAFHNEDGETEIISGHRRVHAARKLGFSTVPVIMKKVTRDEATFLMGASNLTSRETLLPSEKAFAYKAMMEAIGKQERSTGGREKDERTRTILSKQMGVASSQIQRFMRLTELSPELLSLGDEKKLSLRPAVELSYLKKEAQKCIFELYREEGIVPTAAQSRTMRGMQERMQLTSAEIRKLLTGEGDVITEAPYMLAIHSRRLREMLKKDHSIMKRENRMLWGLQMVEEQEKKWRDEYEEEQRWKCEAVRGSTTEEFSNTGTEEDY